MLTHNAWQHDSRVMREAEAVSSAGYDVTVVCRGPRTLVEEAGGVTYVVVERPLRTPLRVLPHAFRTHIRVLITDGSGILRGPDRADRFLSGVEAAALCVLCVPAALVGGSLWALRRNHTFHELWRRAEWRQRLATRVRKIAGAAWQPSVYLNEYAVATSGQLAELRPSVVHAHDLVTLSAGAAVSQATGAALVYDAHELETETNYWTLNSLTRRELRRYERSLTQRTTAVVTVCDSIADWLAKEYRLPRPVVVLNAPTETTADAHGDLRQTLGLGPTVPLAVYVGSVTIDRGLENCVLALAHAPSLHLATVGPRNSDVEWALLDLAADTGVTDRLHLVDPVSPEHVTRYIATASCSVIAIQNVCLSYAFCLPNKLLESVFAGLPVAVSDLPEMRRFVEAAGCGIVMDETDPAAIAHALTALADDPDRYRLRGEELRRVTREFGWPAQRTKLLELYANLNGSVPAA
jgi:glycosyltransferase involved in cell wall biosynthesis